MWDDWRALVGAAVTIVVGSAFWSGVAKWLIGRELRRYDKLEARVDKLEDDKVTPSEIKDQLKAISDQLTSQDTARGKLNEKIEATVTDVHKVHVKVSHILGRLGLRAEDSNVD